MLEGRREKPEVVSRVLGMGAKEKWNMLKAARQQEAAGRTAKELGETANEPESWITVIHVEPSSERLQQLAVMLRTQPINWVEEFVMLRGVSALCELLDLYLSKQTRSERDSTVMLHTLHCLKALMNVELGMEAMVGGEAFTKLQEEMHKAGEADAALDLLLRPSEVNGLTRLVQSVERGRENEASCLVHNEALLLLAGAVSYSAEAHKIALAAFDSVKTERRKLQRFSELVDGCQPPAPRGRSDARHVMAQYKVDTLPPAKSLFADTCLQK